MATKSAAKAHRQSIKARLRNRAIKTATKTVVKKANAAIASGDMEAAREAARTAIVTLDRAAQKGVLHPNNAARHKSRLLLKFNAAVAALQVPVEAATTKKAPAKKAATTKKAPAKKAAPKKAPAKKTAKK